MKTRGGSVAKLAIAAMPCTSHLPTLFRAKRKVGNNGVTGPSDVISPGAAASAVINQTNGSVCYPVLFDGLTAEL